MTPKTGRRLYIKPKDMQANGNPWTKLVVPSKLQLKERT